MILENPILIGVTPIRAVKFVVQGEPRSKQRPRVTQRGTFTPKETIEAEKRVRQGWRIAGESKFEHQVIVDLRFYNGNKRRRDIDNMAKLVLDALNKEAFDDDYQVVGVNMYKFFTDPDRARTEIIIQEVVEWPDERQAVPALFSS